MIAAAGTSLQLVMVDLSCYVGVGVSLPLAQPRREVIAALSKLSQSWGIPLKQQYHARIYVTLRPSVLDPAGTAVQSGLEHMGYADVESVRIGKYIEVNLAADDEAEAHSQLDRMCDQLLANPVIENYRIELGNRE
jgi:phosphoribosylformylglycinamidine synthase subunit PurS